ncbi:hypothetical protein HAX54_049739 [Datura stramonium]|uniref:Uncharacterized protein n=1 Tax=Datura stramonium TaxID=4076 RepID=A0ABS8SVB2_DATST|nr:hypothetical protein [Datura stramonium]
MAANKKNLSMTLVGDWWCHWLAAANGGWWFAGERGEWWCAALWLVEGRETKENMGPARGRSPISLEKMNGEAAGSRAVVRRWRERRRRLSLMVWQFSSQSWLENMVEDDGKRCFNGNILWLDDGEARKREKERKMEERAGSFAAEAAGSYGAAVVQCKFGEGEEKKERKKRATALG